MRRRRRRGSHLLAVYLAQPAGAAGRGRLTGCARGGRPWSPGAPVRHCCSWDAASLAARRRRCAQGDGRHGQTGWTRTAGPTLHGCASSLARHVCLSSSARTATGRRTQAHTHTASANVIGRLQRPRPVCSLHAETPGRTANNRAMSKRWLRSWTIGQLGGPHRPRREQRCRCCT